MAVLDLAQWFLPIGVAAMLLALAGMLVWWFADYDGFNRRFVSLPDAAQFFMVIVGWFSCAALGLQGDNWATVTLALASCGWLIAFVIRLRRRPTA